LSVVIDRCVPPGRLNFSVVVRGSVIGVAAGASAGLCLEHN